MLMVWFLILAPCVTSSLRVVYVEGDALRVTSADARVPVVIAGVPKERVIEDRVATFSNGLVLWSPSKDQFAIGSIEGEVYTEWNRYSLPGMCAAALSPDQKQLCVVARDRLRCTASCQIFTTAGNNTVTALNRALGNSVQLSVSWSPDSRLIAVASDLRQEKSKLYCQLLASNGDLLYDRPFSNVSIIAPAIAIGWDGERMIRFEVETGHRLQEAAVPWARAIPLATLGSTAIVSKMAPISRLLEVSDQVYYDVIDLENGGVCFELIASSGSRLSVGPIDDGLTSQLGKRRAEIEGLFSLASEKLVKPPLRDGR